MAEAVRRAGVDPDTIDEVILGAANQSGEDNRNVARMVVPLAGFPDHVPGITVNRLCASGMSAVTIAAQMVRAGDADIVIAGGVESMSRAPWVLQKPENAFARPGDIVDSAIRWRFINPRIAARGKATYSMTETAEEVAALDRISREDADAFAFRSHQLAIAAIEAGRFKPEMVPVTTGKGFVVDRDEGPRPETSLAALSKLPAVVPGGSIVTAGNSSSLNDGSSAVIVASDRAVRRYSLTPRARVVIGTSAGLAPEIMGLGPVPAAQKALDKSDLSIADIGAVEPNEAFATQSLASMRRLGLHPDIVNQDGGAIALGHPLGSSGSRIVITLLVVLG